MSSGGGGGGSSETTVRYADYVQEHHDRFLNEVETNRIAAIATNPWTETAYVPVEVEDAFFGAGYTIANFPSLYDMYGKFMAGLDIEVLYTQVFEDTVNSPEVNALVSAEGALMDADISANIMPRLQTGMRDINSVIASTYVIGRSLVEDARVKSLAKFSAELKYKLIPEARARWVAHLDWNKLVIATYAEMMKLYYSARTDVDEANYSMAAKKALWPFTILDFERAAVGAMQGATNTKTDVAGASTTQKVLSGAMSGAAMGAMIGSNIKDTSVGAAAGSSYAGYGAIAGAALGAAAAYTY